MCRHLTGSLSHGQISGMKHQGHLRLGGGVSITVICVRACKSVLGKGWHESQTLTEKGGGVCWLKCRLKAYATCVVHPRHILVIRHGIRYQGDSLVNWAIRNQEVNEHPSWGQFLSAPRVEWSSLLVWCHGSIIHGSSSRRAVLPRWWNSTKLQFCLFSLHSHVSMELYWLVGLESKNAISLTICSHLRTKVNCKFQKIKKSQIWGLNLGKLHPAVPHYRNFFLSGYGVARGKDRNGMENRIAPNYNKLHSQQNECSHMTLDVSLRDLKLCLEDLLFFHYPSFPSVLSCKIIQAAHTHEQKQNILK